MSRARRAGHVALPCALVLAVIAASLATAARRPSSGSSLECLPQAVTAAVAWPVATLVISEIQTGGASASDEFAELANAGPAPVDLIGLELVYVTASGSTVTRKATWPATRPLDPGRHLLIANAAGIYAGSADATYSGGFAATGGAIVLRPIGGTPIDAVGWGDATNAFVEGTAAAAPAAGASIERLPGGAAGNGTDTNDNAADFGVASPNPQNLASAPTPDPGATPAPSATPEPTPSTTPSAEPTASVAPSADPVPTPVVTPTPDPTPVPTPDMTPTPTPDPTPVPTATPAPTPVPTPTPLPSPVPTPSAVPTPTPVAAIADARALADGSIVRVAGTLTTDLGAIDSARIGFIQDATDGIAVRLDASLATPVPAGTSVTIEGTLGSYFSLRVINVSAAAVQVDGSMALPEPIGSTTGGASEVLEGIRLSVDGIVAEAPSVLADGLGVTIDDGSGPLRLVVSGSAQAGQSIGTGDHVVAAGPLGQRDSSGTGLAGYRLHATLPGELVVVAPPTPSPTPIPSPSPSPSPRPTTPPSAPPSAPPSPTPTPSSSASVPPSVAPQPSPTPSPLATPTPVPTATSATTVSIAVARSLATGSRVAVGGVVTAEAGRLGTPALIAIQDPTAGIVVRLSDTTPRPAIGTWIELIGTLADPYGQLELRSVTGVRNVEPAALPSPETVDAATVGEDVEARLVSVDGVAQGRPVKSTSGDLAFSVTTAHGSVRIAADASAGLSTSSVAGGEHLRLIGVVGQHASRKGALDGYRVWIRGTADITRLGAPSPSSGSSPSPSPTGGKSAAGATVRTIAAAILAGGGSVTIEGSVTTAASLLDATHRRVIVQDATAAIEVLLPAGARAPALGTRVRVGGEVGRAYGAPRVRAAAVRVLGIARMSPLELRVAPGAAHEWRLVRVRGDVVEVHRSGDRWTAELLVGGTRVPIVGLAGAAIPSAALSEGRTATVIGIVRRPYPSATDRRFAIVPRSSGDLTVGGAADSGGPTGSAGAGSGATGSGAPRSSSSSAAAGPVEIDLVELAAHVGQTVRVGGLVGAVQDDGFRLDDGTAVTVVRLQADAADVAGSIIVGDALSATGRVELDPAGGAPLLAVDDPASIVLVGDLGAGLGSEPSADASDPAASPDTAAATGDRRSPSVTAGLADPAIPELGVIGIALISLASLGVTLLRRQRARRRFAARIADRLAGIVVPGAAPGRSALAGSAAATGGADRSSAAMGLAGDPAAGGAFGPAGGAFRPAGRPAPTGGGAAGGDR